MYLHYLLDSAWIHFTGETVKWLSPPDRWLKIFRSGGSRKPEWWLILVRIIQSNRIRSNSNNSSSYSSMTFHRFSKMLNGFPFRATRNREEINL